MQVAQLEASLNLTVNGPVSPQQFADWLKGFLDATGGTLTPEQVEQVKQKLATVNPWAGWLWFGGIAAGANQPLLQPWEPNITWNAGVVGGQ